MKKKEEGFIGTIILVVVALALLKYFLDFSIFEAASTPQGQETVSYAEKVIRTIWSYLSVPFYFIWDKILSPVIGLIWATFQDFIIYSRDVANNE